MNMLKVRTALFRLVLVSLWACLPGHSPARPCAFVSAYTQEGTEGLVHVTVTVLGKKQVPIADLKKEEFQIEEGKQKQTVETFAPPGSSSLVLGLLIDQSNSLRLYKHPFAVLAEKTFLERSVRPGDVAFVAAFADKVYGPTDLTTDTAQLQTTVERLASLPPQGATALYGTIQWSCRERLSSIQGRRALVILTDGMETMSPGSLEETLEIVQRTDAVIYLLFVESSGPPLIRERDGQLPTVRLAEETGGRMILVRNEKELEQALGQISEELRSQYTLGYYPINKTRDGKFRKIKIETTRSGLKVLARKGYYAPKN